MNSKTPERPEGYQRSSGPSLLDPANLLRIALRRWMVLLLLTGLGFLGGLLYIYMATPIYNAEAELEMSIRRPKVVNSDVVFEDSNSGYSDEDVIFNTRFAKFKSPAMERLATQEYFKRYPEDANENGDTYVNKYLLATLIRDVDWYKDPLANIVYVSYADSNPEFAAKLVNTLTYCAAELMMQENQEQSEEAVKWLISQVEEQRNSIEEVEKELSNMREELQLDSLQQQRIAMGQALVSVAGEKETLISTLASREAVYDFMVKLKDSTQSLEMLPSGLPKEEQLDELIRTWRSANEEMLLAAGRYTELHPEYRKIAEKEARARSRLDQFIDLTARSVQNEMELQRRQIEQMEERIKSMNMDLSALDQKLAVGMQRIQSLERQRDATDNAYQSMLRRMEEAQLSADESMAFAKVIRKATVPSIPVSPKKVQAVFLGTLLGGVIGFVLIVVFAFFSDTVTSVSELRSMGISILGVIPSQKKAESRNDLGTIGLRDKFCPFVEVFAGINALISSEKYIVQTRMLLVGSAMPGEGKTVSSCNLAICSAMNGTRTLLIDGDLRRPQLANVFSMDEEHPSLLEWLVGKGNETTHEALVFNNVIENLDIIISRAMKDINPVELLGRGRLAELLSWARKHYDRVIIDSPPLGAVGDAQVLANFIDSVILVSRVGKVRHNALRFVLARFQEIDANILGCIANDVPNTLAGMFGGGEGYGYGYGYGYGSYKSHH